MAREKKTVHKVQMTDGKRQIIHQLPDRWCVLLEDNTLSHHPDKLEFICFSLKTT